MLNNLPEKEHGLIMYLILTFVVTYLKQNSDLVEPKIDDLSRIMHWISFLFSRLRFFSLYSSLRRPPHWKRSETITNYKLLTIKNTTNHRSFNIWK